VTSTLRIAFVLSAVHLAFAARVTADVPLESDEGASSEVVEGETDPDPDPDPRGPRRERAAAVPMNLEAEFRRAEPVRARSPWHGGRIYVQAGMITAVPVAVRVGASPRPGLAIGLELAYEPYVALSVSRRWGRFRERGLAESFSASAFVSIYPGSQWFHVDAGVGIVRASHAWTDADGEGQSEFGSGARAFTSLGGEWRHSQTRRQHWGLGLALCTGVAYVVAPDDEFIQVDFMLHTTATWF